MGNTEQTARVYLSLGSNIDRAHNIRSGLQALAAAFGELAVSPVYESEAVGFSGDAFYNLVVGIDTTLSVGELAAALRDIEKDHGRVRGEKKFSSRTLDIDILTYDDLTGEIDGVQLPRDEILKHAFVLKPLVDLAPDAIHPEIDKPYRQLLEESDFAGQALWVVEFDA
ncbi:2-amino-4-hydroxy-6-hydroxymethyldihydropteridine diphosphokinase [Alcanivorax sp.]|jgi:2-amino-4-hydroxy-6-hydroxymethyldihydropteridine diphosphokinase|uniref:2-amino-4-hydroxy-6- hydroxymethyldihydropteridine diphosphokinase n=2 Tax=Alcanivorax sp. TaxID=1872427 RepID=UPI0019A673A6|nr:2-amino-4-hydroxy-6-hydroxymethyldihydropteridine diphosphokinase [Alcanivorax sp.]MBD3645599.1 2-amino-4-hydroxy-6-hydroxymethyldihydropteridine diphosphokinase [Alcanivorax sp.]